MPREYCYLHTHCLFVSFPVYSWLSFLVSSYVCLLQSIPIYLAFLVYSYKTMSIFINQSRFQFRFLPMFFHPRLSQRLFFPNSNATQLSVSFSFFCLVFLSVGLRVWILICGWKISSNQSNTKPIATTSNRIPSSEKLRDFLFLLLPSVCLYACSRKSFTYKLHLYTHTPIFIIVWSRYKIWNFESYTLF